MQICRCADTVEAESPAVAAKTIRVQLKRLFQAADTDALTYNLSSNAAESIAKLRDNVLTLEVATTLEDGDAAVWRTAMCGTLLFKKKP